jgi:hypothetical protein
MLELATRGDKSAHGIDYVKLRSILHSFNFQDSTVRF